MLATVLLVFFWPAKLLAQSNYRLAPVGGRSQLLGGTGVVYGRDASASFLNPATSVLVDDRRLSFSVNFYTASFVYAPRWYRPGEVDRSKFGDLEIDDATMTDLEFAALPSSLCLFFKAGDIGFLAKAEKMAHAREARLGFCLATTEHQEFNFAAEGFDSSRGGTTTRQAQTLSQSFTRFSAGPTYGMYLTNNIAIGMSLHASLAFHRSLFAASATTYGAGGSKGPPINSTFYNGSRGDSLQFDGTVGLTYRLSKKQTLGISFRSPSVHIFGVGGANQQFFYDGAGTANSVLSETGSFVSRSPARLAIGTGYDAKWGMLEFNMAYFTPLGQSFTAELEGSKVDSSGAVVTDTPVRQSLSEPARAVVNLALGAELHASPKLGILTGVATDFSSVKEGALRGSVFNYYPYRSHRVTASLGFNVHGEEGDVMLGAEASAGYGERMAVNSYQLPPSVGTTGHGTYQLMLIIAGSTSLRSLQNAVDQVREVVSPPKKPAPAPAPK